MKNFKDSVNKVVTRYSVSVTKNKELRAIIEIAFLAGAVYCAEKTDKILGRKRLKKTVKPTLSR